MLPTEDLISYIECPQNGVFSNSASFLGRDPQLPRITGSLSKC